MKAFIEFCIKHKDIIKNSFHPFESKVLNRTNILHWFYYATRSSALLSSFLWIDSLGYRYIDRLTCMYCTYIDFIQPSVFIKRNFPRQSLKRFTFRVKSSDSIFFLGFSPIVNEFYIISKSY